MADVSMGTSDHSGSVSDEVLSLLRALRRQRDEDPFGDVDVHPRSSAKLAQHLRQLWKLLGRVGEDHSHVVSEGPMVHLSREVVGDRPQQHVHNRREGAWERGERGGGNPV